VVERSELKKLLYRQTGQSIMNT